MESQEPPEDAQPPREDAPATGEEALAPHEDAPAPVEEAPAPHEDAAAPHEEAPTPPEDVPAPSLEGWRPLSGRAFELRAEREPIPQSPPPRGAWRVLVTNQAQRLEDELVSLLDSKPPPGAVVDLVYRGIDRARNAAAPTPVARPKWYVRVLDWWAGGRAETAWGALHEAGQMLFENQSYDAVFAQIPEIFASVSSSLKEDDPRRTAYLKELNKYEEKSADQLQSDDIAALARIKRTADAAADTAYGNVRTYRNLLLALGVGLTMLLGVMAVLHAFVPSFLSFKEPAGTDAPEVWAIEIAGFFGGSIAAVLALSRLEGFTGPYNLTGYQAMLRLPMSGAVALLGIVLLQSEIFTALKPVHGLDLYAYAIFFGYAQEPLLRMVDKQAATVLESARGKNDPAGSAGKSSG